MGTPLDDVVLLLIPVVVALDTEVAADASDTAVVTVVALVVVIGVDETAELVVCVALVVVTEVD